MQTPQPPTLPSAVGERPDFTSCPPYLRAVTGAGLRDRVPAELLELVAADDAPEAA